MNFVDVLSNYKYISDCVSSFAPIDSNFFCWCHLISYLPQVVDISSPRVSEQQVIGVLIRNIDTSLCTFAAGVPCPLVENRVTGSYQLQVSPFMCTTLPLLLALT